MQLPKKINRTRMDGVPLHGGAGAVASGSGHADPVALAAAQQGDVAGGAVGGAVHVVRDVVALGRGVVGQDATAGGPGDHGRVAAAVHRLLQARVRAGAWWGEEDGVESNFVPGSSQNFKLQGPPL